MFHSRLGEDDAAARSWLATPDLDPGDRPGALIAMVRGLIRVNDHVDALRARA